MSKEYEITNGKFIIKTEATDWYDELQKEEPNISTVDNAVKTMIKEHRHPAQMGRMCLMAELLGRTKEEIVGNPKPLLQTASALAFHSQLQRRKKQFKTKSGKEYSVREIVAPVSEINEDGEIEASDEPHVMIDNPKAAEYAMKYLQNRVPGYIKGRLNIIAAAGGNVENAANQLKLTIDEMVTNLK